MNKPHHHFTNYDCYFTKEDISIICHKYKVLNDQLGLGANKFFKAFISFTPWLGCCIVEHKTMGPSFKVDTQSMKVPTTFKYIHHAL
jgi:hypothetical protein